MSFSTGKGKQGKMERSNSGIHSQAGIMCNQHSSVWGRKVGDTRGFSHDKRTTRGKSYANVLRYGVHPTSSNVLGRKKNKIISPHPTFNSIEKEDWSIFQKAYLEIVENAGMTFKSLLKDTFMMVF